MKKFVGKVSLLLLVCILLAMIPSYCVDPYNVFHWRSIRNNGLEPNKNYIKTRYILDNPDRYDGFLFGSSRVGAIHVEKIESSNIYNMTYSNGLPREHYETLKTFIDGNVSFDKVYVGVDSFSYTEEPSDHYSQGIRAPYQYLQNGFYFVKLYMDPGIIVQSIKASLLGNEIDGFDAFYEYGWWADYDTESSYEWINDGPSLGAINRMEDTLREIQMIVDLCKDNNLQVVFFTNPMYEVSYRESVEKEDYFEFLAKLAEIVPYYNFSSLNDITTNSCNYLDQSHYNAYVGDLIVNSIEHNDCDDLLIQQGFGYYVTSENVVEFLEILRQQ